MRLFVPFRDAPIRSKLMLIGLLTTALALFSVSIIIVAKDWVGWREKTASEMEIYAILIGANAAPSMIFGDYDAATEVLQTLGENPNIVDAVLYDKDGKVFARYRTPEHPGSAFPFVESDSYLFTFNQLVVSKPVLFKGEAWGTVYLESDLHGLYAEIKRHTLLTFIISAGVFMVAVFLFSRLQRTIVDPITTLSGVMRTVSAKQDYAVRVPVHGKDEVGMLASTFNDMLERIQARDAELEDHRMHLEEEVVERTAALKESNLLLEQELGERKLMEEKIRVLNEELEIKVQERTRQLLETQEELVRKEKLSVLGQVAGSVGHELRNPLGVMSNAVYFLQTVLADADDSVKEYLNIIKSEIAGSERIVSDLLDSVRTKPPQPEVVGAAELIELTLRKYSVPPSVAVTLDIPETLSPLRVDAQQIHQVLRNLISNGVEAMPEGGVLEIRALENKSDGTITVSVRDSGIGMTPEHLSKLFQPLYTTKARGIGLGLVVVKNLTKANGGSVEVQSELGKGTVFAITLPAANEKGISL